MTTQEGAKALIDDFKEVLQKNNTLVFTDTVIPQMFAVIKEEQSSEKSQEEPDLSEFTPTYDENFDPNNFSDDEEEFSEDEE